MKLAVKLPTKVVLSVIYGFMRIVCMYVYSRAGPPHPTRKPGDGSTLNDRGTRDQPPNPMHHTQIVHVTSTIGPEQHSNTPPSTGHPTIYLHWRNLP